MQNKNSGTILIYVADAFNKKFKQQNLSCRAVFPCLLARKKLDINYMLLLSFKVCGQPRVENKKKGKKPRFSDHTSFGSETLTLVVLSNTSFNYVLYIQLQPDR